LSSTSAGASEAILALSYQLALPQFSTAMTKRMGSLPFEGREEAARVLNLYTFGVPKSPDPGSDVQLGMRRSVRRHAGERPLVRFVGHRQRGAPASAWCARMIAKRRWRMRDGWLSRAGGRVLDRSRSGLMKREPGSDGAQRWNRQPQRRLSLAGSQDQPIFRIRGY
jgi:hypothetical protein